MKKADLLNKLYSEYRNEFCEYEIVTGDGSCDAKILFVGEAPGKDEVLQNRPFVGAAGKNLSEFLEILNLGRDEVYVTNAIKYRLSRINELTGRVSNRPCKKTEIQTGRPYLIKEIEIIKPQYVITLGNIAFKAVTDDFSLNIGAHHGEIHNLTNSSEFKLFPLYHPASIIYNRDLKNTYIGDIKKLKEILKM